MQIAEGFEFNVNIYILRLHIMPSTRVSILEKIKLYLYVIKLNATKKKRDHKVISENYNVGFWNSKKYEDIDFNSRSGMYGHKPDEVSIFTINDKMFKGKYSEFEPKYQTQIFDVMDQYIDECIVELGCGLGVGLFLLADRNFKNLEGYDIANNAISFAKRRVEEKNYDIKFGVVDLTKPISVIENKIIYTNGCLEQLKHYMPNVLQNIVNGKPKLVINFELDYDDCPFLVRKYMDGIDCQNNLIRELRKLEKKGVIEIISINKFPLSISPVKRASAIIWKPLL